MRTGFGGTGTAIAAFALVAAVVLGGLWWMTEAALRLETEQGEVRAAVDLNNRLRIALWRLDGRISPVLAQESARPFEHYSAVFAPAAALDAHGSAWPAGAILEPSPLLDASLPAWMRLHFQFETAGPVVSPQAPPDALVARLLEAEVAVGNVTTAKRETLAELQQKLDPARLAALLPPPKADESAPPPVFGVQSIQTAAVQSGQDASGVANEVLPNAPFDAIANQAGQDFQQLANQPDGQPGPQRPVAPSNEQAPLAPKAEPSDAPSSGSGVGGALGGPGGGGATEIPQFVPGGYGFNDFTQTQQQKREQERLQTEDVQQATYPQQQIGGAQGDYALRVAQRGAVAKDVANNSMKPGKSYNAYANDANLAWLTAGTGAYAVVPDAPVEVGPLTPVWLPSKTPGESDLLVAARLVRLGERVVCQGVLIDWPALRDELAREIHDLFPAADLRAGRVATADALERTMTALPVQLDPSQAPTIAAVGWSPLRTGVAIAWTAALAALLSAGLGGWSLWELSQRRIRFVSAVTHELRTPLTTLRLYLDMLTSGLVRDETRQAEYLQTLNAESDRLNRLITNVLEFSRLEGRSSNVQPREIPIDALLAEVAADWELRCRDAGKTLVVENALAGRTLVVDERLAQQILGILVDNACKYSRGADDRRVWLRADADGRGGAVFEVEDRGPGVPPTERRRVFQPFWRGRRDDAAAGGVGLGLTLAERWTRLLRGRLSVETPLESTGARFRLQLPGLVEPPAGDATLAPPGESGG